MKVKKGVYLVWHNKDKVRIDRCTKSTYTNHIKNKDLRIMYLYSYRDNYPRKIIETPHEYFSTKLI